MNGFVVNTTQISVVCDANGSCPIILYSEVTDINVSFNKLVVAQTSIKLADTLI